MAVGVCTCLGHSNFPHPRLPRFEPPLSPPTRKLCGNREGESSFLFSGHLIGGESDLELPSQQVWPRTQHLEMLDVSQCLDGALTPSIEATGADQQ